MAVRQDGGGLVGSCHGSIGVGVQSHAGQSGVGRLKVPHQGSLCLSALLPEPVSCPAVHAVLALQACSAGRHLLGTSSSHRMQGHVAAVKPLPAAHAASRDMLCCGDMLCCEAAASSSRRIQGHNLVAAAAEEARPAGPGGRAAAALRPSQLRRQLCQRLRRVRGCCGSRAGAAAAAAGAAAEAALAARGAAVVGEPRQAAQQAAALAAPAVAAAGAAAPRGVAVLYKKLQGAVSVGAGGVQGVASLEERAAGGRHQPLQLRAHGAGHACARGFRAAS